MQRSLGSNAVVALTLASIVTVATVAQAGSPFDFNDLGKLASSVQKQGSGSKNSGSKKASTNDWTNAAGKIINDFGGHPGWEPKPMPHPQPKPCPQPLPFPPIVYPKPCPKPCPPPIVYPKPCPTPIVYPKPCPTPILYPKPCPTPIVCPVNPLPTPVCPVNPLPVHPVDGHVVTVINPTITGGRVQFRLDDAQFQLDAGYQQAATTAGSHKIVFDRGGSFGEAHYTLSEGTYQFVVSDRGWDLEKKSYRVTIDNSQGQYDFRYTIAGELHTVAAGDTNQHKDSFPLVVEFDQGRGESAERMLEEGTYGIGINPETGLWDMFAQDTSLVGNPLPSGKALPGGNPLPNVTPLAANASVQKVK
ncbi:MAG: hypothetical protein R3C10_24595 [Pirellulales bacterium]